MMQSLLLIQDWPPDTTVELANNNKLFPRNHDTCHDFFLATNTIFASNLNFLFPTHPIHVSPSFCYPCQTYF